MKKAIKGDYHYLKTKGIQVMMMTILYFLLSLAIFLMGYLSTGKKDNMLTIVAMLGCLPACKSLVSMIMYMKAAGCSQEAKEKLDSCAVSFCKLKWMHDMYFTSYKQNYAISHIVVCGKNICGYTESKGCDCNACEAHLSKHLKQGGYKEMTVKIFTDINKYIERLKQLNQLEQQGSIDKDDELRAFLAEISL